MQFFPTIGPLPPRYRFERSKYVVFLRELVQKWLIVPLADIVARYAAEFCIHRQLDELLQRDVDYRITAWKKLQRKKDTYDQIEMHWRQRIDPTVSAPAAWKLTWDTRDEFRWDVENDEDALTAVAATLNRSLYPSVTQSTWFACLRQFQLLRQNVSVSSNCLVPSDVVSNVKEIADCIEEIESIYGPFAPIVVYEHDESIVPCIAIPDSDSSPTCFTGCLLTLQSYCI